MENVDNELFDSQNANVDAMQKYPKLPDREHKQVQNDPEPQSEEQASTQVAEGSSSAQEPASQADQTAQSEQSAQNESKRMEDKNIREAIQKGEEQSENTLISTKEPESQLLSSFELNNDIKERQQKTVEINSEISYIKIKCFENHQNKLNVFNQIGIISILCYGKILEQEKQDLLSRVNQLGEDESKREDPSQDSYLNMRRQSNTVKVKTSALDMFDDKIAALNTSKQQAVDNEDYVEAEKLKQIITKIEKLKVYIEKLEVQKVEHANNENYDQAKKIKNEIDRIKSVVLSITSGTNARPKIIPSVTKKSQFTIIPSQENFGASHRGMNAYENNPGWKPGASKKSFSHYTDNELSNRQGSFTSMKGLNASTNLKTATPYKRSGILKIKGQAANLDNSMNSAYDPGTVNTTMNLSYGDEQDDDPYLTDGKKHVRIMDPRQGRNMSRSPLRTATKTSNDNYLEKIRSLGFKGYKQKNSDNTIVPGALRKTPIDFAKVEDKATIEQSGAPQEPPSSNIDEIDPSEMHRAQPYFEFFKKETVKKIFSRKWQSKLEGYSDLIDEFKNNSESSGTDAQSFNEKKQECLELMTNAVERGLRDKIVKVRIKACDLLTAMVRDNSQKTVDYKDLGQPISVLVDFLTDNNQKLKKKGEETIQVMLQETNTPLETIEESKPQPSTSQQSNLLSLLLSPPNPIKPLTRAQRDKLQRSFLLSYQELGFDPLKPFTTNLDPDLQKALSKSIPALKPPTPPKSERELMAEDTSRRIAQMKKEKLRSLKMKHGASLTDLENKGIVTDIEKERTCRKEKLAKTHEQRNQSIDRLRRNTENMADRQTQQLKDKIRKNLEAMRFSQNKGARVKTGDVNKHIAKRNITPMKSRNKSSLEKGKRELKTSTKSKREELHSNKPEGIVKAQSSKNLKIDDEKSQAKETTKEEAKEEEKKE